MIDKLKAVVAALMSALAVANTVLAHYQPPAGAAAEALDWRTIVAELLIPLLVYLVPNLPKLTGGSVIVVPPEADPVVTPATALPIDRP
jgi:hypothetical protein